MPWPRQNNNCQQVMWVRRNLPPLVRNRHGALMTLLAFLLTISSRPYCPKMQHPSFLRTTGA